MSQPELNPNEADFETQLATLIVEAARSHQQSPPPEEQHPVEKKPLPAPAPLPPAPPAANTHSVLQMLKPMVLGIEALSRAVAENSAAIGKVESALIGQAELPMLMSEVQETLERKQMLNQRLFDSLYEELRGYKDGFLLEVLHKPVVRDLVTLFDDLSNLHTQMESFIGEHAQLEDLTDREHATLEQVKTLETNLDHIAHSLIEVMERMEVTRMEPSVGKLNKVTQRAIAIETAECEEDDYMVARSVKPGFLWRDRVVRPELVVMKKWKDNYLVALPETQK
jgi:molecular chaperone GrpE (heat shock protein)